MRDPLVSERYVTEKSAGSLSRSGDSTLVDGWRRSRGDRENAAPGSAATGNVGRVTERPTDTSVVIIGAGQAGLSVAYYLRRLGLDPGNDFVLLDRGPGPGGAWQFRWEALRLGSAHPPNDPPRLPPPALT